jgi:hypothetical protein
MIVFYWYFNPSIPWHSSELIIIPSVIPDPTHIPNHSKSDMVKKKNIELPQDVIQLLATKTEDGIRIVWLGTGDDIKSYSVYRCYGDYTCTFADEQQARGKNNGRYMFVDILDEHDYPSKYYVSALDWSNIESVPTAVTVP